MTTHGPPAHPPNTYSPSNIISDDDNKKPQTRRRRKPKPPAEKSKLNRPLIRFFCNDCQKKFQSRILANRNNNAVQHYCSLYEKIITRKVGAHSNKCKGSHGVGPCVVKRTDFDPNSDGEDETKLAYYASKGVKRSGPYSRNPRPSKKRKTSSASEYHHNGGGDVASVDYGVMAHALPPYIAMHADIGDSLPPMVQLEPPPPQHHHALGGVDEPPMDGHNESSLPPMPVLMQMPTSTAVAAAASPPPPPPPPLEEFDAPPLEYAPVGVAVVQHDGNDDDEKDTSEAHPDVLDKCEACEATSPPAVLKTDVVCDSVADDEKINRKQFNTEKHANNGHAAADANNRDSSVEYGAITNGGTDDGERKEQSHEDEDDDLGVDLSPPSMASPSAWVKCNGNNNGKKEELVLVG